MKADQLRRDKERLSNEVTILKDQLAVERQERSLLGKRNDPIEPEEAVHLEQAVTREIKRRRGNNQATDTAASLEERRADDKAKISEMLKDYKQYLVPWSAIMRACLYGKRPQPF